MADGKNITDIVPPEEASKVSSVASSGDNSEVSATASVISKHSSTITVGQDDNNPTQSVSTNAETQGSDDAPKKVSKMGVDLQPQSVESSTNDTSSKDEKKIDSTGESIKEGANDADNTSEPEAPAPTPASKARFEASDSLPDENDKRTTEATDDMQAPKIYDTKEYFVPIKNTTHSHGHIGTVIAGIVSALVVLAAVAFAAVYFY